MQHSPSSLEHKITCMISQMERGPHKDTRILTPAHMNFVLYVSYSYERKQSQKQYGRSNNETKNRIHKKIQ